MPEKKVGKCVSFVDDVADIVPSIAICAITAWGAKLAWAKCVSVHMWIAKGFFGCLAGVFAISTVFTVAIMVIFVVELVKDYAPRSK